MNNKQIEDILSLKTEKDRLEDFLSKKPNTNKLDWDYGSLYLNEFPVFRDRINTLVKFRIGEIKNILTKL